MDGFIESFTQNLGWLEMAVPYSIALGVAYWQWSKMRREVREMRAEREAREAEEAARKDVEDREKPEV